MKIAILKYCLCIVFILSAVSKLIDFNNTMNLYLSITGLSYETIKAGLVIIIMMELFFAFLILFGFVKKKQVYFSLVIMIAAFTAVNILFLLLGIDNCGCFGTLFKIGPLESIGKNIFLIILLFLLRLNMLKEEYE